MADVRILKAVRMSRNGCSLLLGFGDGLDWGWD